MFDSLKRRLHGIKDFTVRDLPEVTVGRLVGTVRALDGATVIAPLSGRACLAYVARAVASIRGHRPDRGDDVAVEVGGVRFALEDATGSAIVDPENATSLLAWDYRPATMDLYGDATARHEAWLKKYREDLHARSLHFTWYEAIVIDGQRIGVTGFGHRDDAGRLTMSTSPHLQLALDNGDG